MTFASRTRGWGSSDLPTTWGRIAAGNATKYGIATEQNATGRAGADRGRLVSARGDAPTVGRRLRLQLRGIADRADAVAESWAARGPEAALAT